MLSTLRGLGSAAKGGKQAEFAGGTRFVLVVVVVLALVLAVVLVLDGGWQSEVRGRKSEDIGIV